MTVQPQLVVDFDNGGEEALLGDDTNLDAQGFPVALEGIAVDAASDPAKANAISAAALSLTTETEDFSISGPPDGRAVLIGGYIDADGYRHVDCEVKELTGADEEAIAKAEASRDIARYVDTIVKRGTVRIGEVTERRELDKALDSLLVGDRDLLILQIRRNTFGDTMRLDIVCPFCDAPFQVDYSFAEDVPMRGINVEGASDPSQRRYDFPLPSGKVASVRLMDGLAQKRVYTPDNLGKTSAELDTIMLAELVETLDGKPVQGIGPVRDLGARDRKALIAFFADTQPGPQYSDVKQSCPDCGKEFPLEITVRDMFRGD